MKSILIFVKCKTGNDQGKIKNENKKNKNKSKDKTRKFLYKSNSNILQIKRKSPQILDLMCKKNSFNSHVQCVAYPNIVDLLNFNKTKKTNRKQTDTIIKLYVNVTISHRNLMKKYLVSWLNVLINSLSTYYNQFALQSFIKWRLNIKDKRISVRIWM